MSDEDADLENDSRPSLLSLYPDYMSYVNKLRDATDSLVSKNLLLQEDADLLLQRVEESIPLH
jgi:hypothetical protein